MHRVVQGGSSKGAVSAERNDLMHEDRIGPSYSKLPGALPLNPIPNSVRLPACTKILCESGLRLPTGKQTIVGASCRNACSPDWPRTGNLHMRLFFNS